MSARDAVWAVQQYDAVRSLLPAASSEGQARRVPLERQVRPETRRPREGKVARPADHAVFPGACLPV